MAVDGSDTTSEDEVALTQELFTSLEARQPSWKRYLIQARWAVGGAFAVALVWAAAAVLAPASRASSTPENSFGGPHHSILVAAEGPAKKCSAMFNEDCSKTQCCKDEGYQCYAKNKFWATCMKTCNPVVMKKNDPKKQAWSCTAIGQRSRCANTTEDCRSMACCADSGHMCYAKNAGWAACLKGCDPPAMKKYDPKHEAWACTAIGHRNFKSSCTWAGEDCTRTHCCNNNGFICAQKDKYFAGCTQSVKHTSAWFSKKVPIPAGWSGKVLGGGRDEYQVAPTPKNKYMAGTAIFCFMAILPGTSEEALMNIAKARRVGIFGCNESLVLHSWKSKSSAWGGSVATVVNTDVFINVWNQVAKDGRYLNFDWTVKADADCVFFADRLRAHLWQLRPPPYTPIYLKNNAMNEGLGNGGFLGAIEIFSKTAMQTYFANWEGCKKTMGLNAGEDGFFKGCMDALGVGFMRDVNIFNPDYSPGACSNGGKVAFHPIKKPHDWECCVDIAYGKPRTVNYGHCA